MDGRIVGGAAGDSGVKHTLLNQKKKKKVIDVSGLVRYLSSAGADMPELNCI